MQTRYLKIAAVIGLAMLTGACAASRSVVEIQEPAKIENPATGPAVKIVSVEDKRQFEIDPSTPDIPSLSNDEIDDVTFTSRAYARKRNGYGMAMGDVLLPEGKTVADAVNKAISNGFKQAGYRVLEPGDAEYDSADAVDADLIKFWSWFEPGFWQVTVHNKSEVTLKGNELNKGEPVTVTDSYQEKMQMVLDSDWQSSAVNALRELSSKIAEKLETLK